jgi:hypothetical protein
MLGFILIFAWRKNTRTLNNRACVSEEIRNENLTNTNPEHFSFGHLMFFSICPFRACSERVPLCRELLLYL